MTTARGGTRGAPRRRRAAGEQPTPASAVLDAPAKVIVVDPDAQAAETAAETAAKVAEPAQMSGVDGVSVANFAALHAADPVAATSRVVGDSAAAAAQSNQLLIDDATGQLPAPDAVFVPFGHSGTAVTAAIQLNKRIVHPSGSITEQIMVPRGGLVDAVTAGRIVAMLEQQRAFASAAQAAGG